MKFGHKNLKMFTKTGSVNLIGELELDDSDGEPLSPAAISRDDSMRKTKKDDNSPGSNRIKGKKKKFGTQKSHGNIHGDEAEDAYH